MFIIDAPLNFYNFREEMTPVALLPKVTQAHKIKPAQVRTLNFAYRQPFNLVVDDKLS